MLVVIHGTYVPWLVAGSILISSVASYAAFNFAERVAASAGWRSRDWLVAGAVAMGLGIWSMHYLGMLALVLPVQVFYHVPTVILSLLMAIGASVVALRIVSHEEIAERSFIIGGVVMGAAIGGMHYTGMAAMRSSAICHYDPRIVSLSIVVAVVFSWVALHITFSLRRAPSKSEIWRVAGAVLMGSGIAAMHYTAMFAISFIPSDVPYSTAHTVEVRNVTQSGSCSDDRTGPVWRSHIGILRQTDDQQPTYC
jgi:NO-binding membrane sensor protein with MHYT domain